MKRVNSTEDNPHSAKRPGTSVTTNSINALQLDLLDTEVDFGEKTKIIDSLRSIVITGEKSEKITENLIGIYSINKDKELAAYAKKALIKKRIACEELYKYINKGIHNLEEFLIAAIQHSGSDYEVKMKAAEGLEIIGSDRAVQSLITSLSSDPDYRVRMRAAEGLRIIGSDKAVQPLITSLKFDSDYEVRMKAAEGLGILGSDKAVQPLITSLSSEFHFCTRSRSAVALDQIVSHISCEIPLNIDAEAIIKGLTDFYDNDVYNIEPAPSPEYFNVVLFVESALGKIMNSASFGISCKDAIVSSLITKLSTALSDVNILIYNFSNIAYDTKYNICGIIRVLGKIKNDLVVKYLIKALYYPDKYVVREAKRALKNIGTPIAIRYLNTFYENLTKELVVKLERLETLHSLEFIEYDFEEDLVDLIRNLEKIEEYRAEQILVILLSDSDEYVRTTAINALWHIELDRAIQVLNTLLSNSNEDVRLDAVEVLGKIRTDKVVQLLIKALSDSDQHVRCEAVRALVERRTDKAVQPLIKALSDPYEYVRVEAVRALGEIRTDKVIQPLIKALSDPYEYVRVEAVRALGKIRTDKAIQPLIKALFDPDEDIWWEVVETFIDLGNMLPVEAGPHLINSLSDSRVIVSLRAAEALMKITPDKSSDAVVDRMIEIITSVTDYSDEHLYYIKAAVKILGEVGLDKSVQALININAVSFPAQEFQLIQIRLEAAKVLGKIGTDETVPLLLKSIRSSKNMEMANAFWEIGTRTSIKAFFDLLRESIKKCSIGDAKKSELGTIIYFLRIIKCNKYRLENHIKKIDLLCCGLNVLPMYLREDIVNIAMPPKSHNICDITM